MRTLILATLILVGCAVVGCDSYQRINPAAEGKRETPIYVRDRELAEVWLPDGEEVLGVTTHDVDGETTYLINTKTVEIVGSGVASDVQEVVRSYALTAQNTLHLKLCVHRIIPVSQ